MRWTDHKRSTPPDWLEQTLLFGQPSSLPATLRWDNFPQVLPTIVLREFEISLLQSLCSFCQHRQVGFLVAAHVTQVNSCTEVGVGFGDDRERESHKRERKGKASSSLRGCNKSKNHRTLPQVNFPLDCFHLNTLKHHQVLQAGN